MSFNFDQIERGKGIGSGGLPEGIVRVGKKTIGMPEDVASKFNSSRYQSQSGDTKMRLKIAVDKVQQAIQLVSDPAGFAFSVTDGGGAFGAVPVKLRRTGLPEGDYKVVEGEHNIFQLAR